MKQRLFTAAAVSILVLAAGLWIAEGAQPGRSTQPVNPTTPVTEAPASAPSVRPDTPSDHPPEKTPGLYSYAIPITELQGLPPEIAPGTLIDLWVAWQPPITKKTQIQPLLKRVLLERIVPPLLPDGPHSALLQVRVDRAHRLIWGDRFGALSVLTPPHISQS